MYIDKMVTAYKRCHIPEEYSTEVTIMLHNGYDLYDVQIFLEEKGEEMYWSYLYETEVDVNVENNGNMPTIEVYKEMEEEDQSVFCNGKKPFEFHWKLNTEVLKEMEKCGYKCPFSIEKCPCKEMANKEECKFNLFLKR